MSAKKILILFLLTNTILIFLPLILYFPTNIWSIRPLAKILIFIIIYINIYHGRLWARLLYLFFSITNLIYFIALLPLQLSTLKINLISVIYFATIIIQLMTCYGLLYHRGIKHFLSLQAKK